MNLSYIALLRSADQAVRFRFYKHFAPTGAKQASLIRFRPAGDSLRSITLPRAPPEFGTYSNYFRKLARSPSRIIPVRTTVTLDTRVVVVAARNRALSNSPL